MHRHEPPVPAEPVTAIHDDDTVLVVNKPAGMPVHPCGRYRHNTVLGILGHTQGYWNLCVTHRLDRQTSGVLLFAKSPAAAERVRGEMVSHKVKKTYLACVRGQFPEAATCDLSIAMSNARIGVCRADPEKGKPAQTEFIRLRYNEADNTSLVRCTPKTGRMHQIRVHLQCLGHPIVDDNVYARPEWGEEKGSRASDATVARIAEAVERDMHRAGIDLEWDATVAGPLPAEMSSLSEHQRENGDAYLCSQCVREAAAGHVEEVNPSRISLCLHAESYEGPDWRYTAPSPPWATQ
jgi:RluA family pseudouridine synthase